jgi:hypothetical protein
MSRQQWPRNAFLVLLTHTLNPLARQLARSSLGPFSIIRHVGRRSGKRYETPIIVAPRADGFVIELTYGPEVDWHKNIVLALRQHSEDALELPACKLSTRCSDSKGRCHHREGGFRWHALLVSLPVSRGGAYNWRTGSRGAVWPR